MFDELILFFAMHRPYTIAQETEFVIWVPSVEQNRTSCIWSFCNSYDTSEHRILRN